MYKLSDMLNVNLKYQYKVLYVPIIKYVHVSLKYQYIMFYVFSIKYV